MEVGIQSVKNLLQLPIWKTVLWLALLLSTLPLHLLWNSAIFSVTTMNEYIGIVVTSRALESGNIDLDCSEQAMTQYQQTFGNLSDFRNAEKYFTCQLLSSATAGELVQLTPSECMSEYSMKLATWGHNLLIVTNSQLSTI